MIEFDPLHYPYASTRNVVYAKNGMCCAGNPSAASAGLQTLLKGGNAIDAAVAMALAQPVVEPSVTVSGANVSRSSGTRERCMGSTGPARLPELRRLTL